MELWLKKGLRGLDPVDEAGEDFIRHMKLGKLVRAELTTPRNLAMHRKFFALLTLVWSAAGEWPSVEDLLVELKVTLGLTREVVIRGSGEIVKIPASISFAAMSQEDFEKFYERSMRELCQMAGGIKYEALRQEVLQQVAAA